jgi:hypothetical protein
MAKGFQLEVPKQKGTKLEQEFLTVAQAVLKEQAVLRLYSEGRVSTGTAAKAQPDPARFCGIRCRTPYFSFP